MKTKLPVLVLCAMVFLLFAPSVSIQHLSAQTVNHVVISEVQTGQQGTGNTTKEFIELYNPTGSAIDMSGWRLSRKTSGGSLANLVTTMSGEIPAHGYFLIAHPDYDAATLPDLRYTTTSSIASNSTVILYSDAGVTIVDKVGFGEGEKLEYENTPAQNPELGFGLERKACENSNASSMLNGDLLHGNAWDTDNNSTDFLVREIPDPQNSSSVEVPACATATPTATPTPTTTPSASPIPTATTTVTPSPTPTPTVTPTQTPTQTPAPTADPTQSPSSTPKPRPDLRAFTFRMECRVQSVTYGGRLFKINMPRVYCFLVSAR